MRLLLVLLGLAVSGLAAASLFGKVEVSVGEKQLQLELAQSYEARAMGLMHRESLCSDCGMLFEYQQPRVISMWMKNTLIPLDVAFLNAEGEILVIKPMQPHDLTPVDSESPASYAWEMNQGWFAANHIKSGDKVTIRAAM
ncbi:DUF192 domain-containing protein [Bowmanella denitrificans]|uniref:DUF192 domain-containing protein n=1 Tax=Bowmanella denitrificans TaxID=366582 RepID=UPI000C9C8AD9|nr:DUF192 domain-containing protein [Bowmanella denitrificans]